jgi:PHD/YefM family antitoxin component YafN of YafNO toxin-antitoxin module
VEKVSQERPEDKIPLPESNGTRFIAIPEERYKRLQSMEEENNTLWGALEAECELTSKVIAERDKYKAALRNLLFAAPENDVFDLYSASEYQSEEWKEAREKAAEALKGADSQ